MVQLFSITFIFPLMLFISGDYINQDINRDSMQWYEYYVARFFKDIFALFDFSERGFVVFLGLLFIGMFICRSLFILFQGYFFEQERVRHEKFLKTRIFSSFLFVSYSYYLKRSAAESQYVVNLAGVISNFYGKLIITIGNVAFLFIIVGVIVVVQYQVLLLMIGFGIILFFIMKVVTKKLRNYSNMRVLQESEQNVHLYQGIHYYVFSKLHGKEHYFLTRMENVYNKHEVIQKRQSLVTLVPRNVLELLAVTVVIFMMIYLYYLYSGNVGAIYSSLAIIALAFLRVIPAIQSIIAFFTSLSSISGTIKKFYNELTTMQKHVRATNAHATLDAKSNTKTPLLFKDKLVFNKVSFTYPYFDDKGNIYHFDDMQPTLRSISITIPRGHTLGIVGQTGGGKTTLVHLLMGFLNPTKGSIMVDGQDIHKNIRGWHDIVGYVPQDVQLMNASIKENIAFGVNEKDIDEAYVQQLIQKVQLKDFLKEQKHGLNTVIGDFGKRISGGQRQRLGIARALYRDPKVIIFDEATSNLDIKTEAKIQNTIYSISTKKTVIIIAHRTHTLARCDTIISLHRGKIDFSGSYQEYIHESNKS